MSNQTTSTPSEDQNRAPGSSHLSPAPAGFTVKTTIERGDSYFSPRLYDVEVTLLEIVRGKEAWERIKAQGVSDQLPKTGSEYILARVNLGYSRRGRGDEDDPYKLTEGQFAAVSTDGVTEYEIPHVLQQPEPKLIGYTFKSGESHEGWILLQVPEDDKQPLLIFKRQHVEGAYGIWGYIWFQLF